MALRKHLNLLPKREFEILFAQDCHTGYNIAVKRLPDLILLNVQRALHNGYALLEKLQKNSLTSCIPLIVIADLGVDGFRKIMSLGADDALDNSASFLELHSSISARLAKYERILSYIHEVHYSIIRKVPHELRTPLHGILGFAEVIETQGRALHPEEVCFLGKSIRNAGNRLRRRLEKYLLYLELVDLNNDTLTHGIYEDNYRVNPTDLKDALLQKASEFGREQDIKVHSRPANVHIPHGYYIKLVEELIENSVKFSAVNTPVNISAFRRGNYYVTVVADCGVGIPAIEPDQIHVFNQFDRESMNQEGIGLGLAIVQSIINRFNGYLKISRRNKYRTIIEFGLPISKGGNKSITQGIEF